MPRTKDICDEADWDMPDLADPLDLEDSEDGDDDEIVVGVAGGLSEEGAVRWSEYVTKLMTGWHEGRGALAQSTPEDVSFTGPYGWPVWPTNLRDKDGEGSWVTEGDTMGETNEERDTGERNPFANFLKITQHHLGDKDGKGSEAKKRVGDNVGDSDQDIGGQDLKREEGPSMLDVEGYRHSRMSGMSER
ncbi:hypothetical protein JAAARDRAFT_51545 [Jaapia argillacea MUCL 33604]|uniref:Uncharacterized protein n=1 Tax=Jaapia argillacea MUCL 33604 TaxID=933084 RepID=A0A067P4M7_9AGAM|nr:hypothetical protein JAAARDRAFT_51545 [Jaapia argillacea MUCL 33604]